MRNPPRNPQRFIEANRDRTIKRIERYYGKLALLQTWENLPRDEQARNHAYIIRLTKSVRRERCYLEHRADAQADISNGAAEVF